MLSLQTRLEHCQRERDGARAALAATQLRLAETAISDDEIHELYGKGVPRSLDELRESYERIFGKELPAVEDQRTSSTGLPLPERCLAPVVSADGIKACMKLVNHDGDCDPEFIFVETNGPALQGFECPRHGRILYGRRCTDADCECARASEGHGDPQT